MAVDLSPQVILSDQELALQKAAEQRLAGKPLVVTHHATAFWVHTWPKHVETMGGACDWSNPITVRGNPTPSPVSVLTRRNT